MTDTTLNAATIQNYRASYGVETHEDLHRLIDIRNHLAAAYNAALDLDFRDPLLFQDLFDPVSETIEHLDTAIDPTEDDVPALLPDDWDFERNGYVE